MLTWPLSPKSEHLSGRRGIDCTETARTWTITLYWKLTTPCARVAVKCKMHHAGSPGWSEIRTCAEPSHGRAGARSGGQPRRTGARERETQTTTVEKSWLAEGEILASRGPAWRSANFAKESMAFKFGQLFRAAIDKCRDVAAAISTRCATGICGRMAWIERAIRSSERFARRRRTLVVWASMSL